MLKHYLGGHKQLDPLESGPIRTSSNRNEGGGGAGKKNGRKAELCEVHYKVHLTAVLFLPFYTVRPPQIYWCRSLNEINRMCGRENDDLITNGPFFERNRALNLHRLAQATWFRGGSSCAQRWHGYFWRSESDESDRTLFFISFLLRFKRYFSHMLDADSSQSFPRLGAPNVPVRNVHRFIILFTLTGLDSPGDGRRMRPSHIVLEIPGVPQMCYYYSYY